MPATAAGESLGGSSVSPDGIPVADGMCVDDAGAEILGKGSKPIPTLRDAASVWGNKLKSLSAHITVISLPIAVTGELMMVVVSMPEVSVVQTIEGGLKLDRQVNLYSSIA